MKPFLAIVFAALFPVFATAQQAVEIPTPMPEEAAVLAAKGLDLNDFLWLSRPLIIFADSPNDPRFKKQIELIEADLQPFLDRDVVIITDTDPKNPSALRTRLRPRGFMLVLLTKDGSILWRKPAPWTEREISRSIDKLPARQQEVRDRRAAAQ